VRHSDVETEDTGAVDRQSLPVRVIQPAPGGVYFVRLGTVYRTVVVRFVLAP